MDPELLRTLQKMKDAGVKLEEITFMTYVDWGVRHYSDGCTNCIEYERREEANLADVLKDPGRYCERCLPNGHCGRGYSIPETIREYEASFKAVERAKEAKSLRLISGAYQHRGIVRVMSSAEQRRWFETYSEKVYSKLDEKLNAELALELEREVFHRGTKIAGVGKGLAELHTQAETAAFEVLRESPLRVVARWRPEREAFADMALIHKLYAKGNLLVLPVVYASLFKNEETIIVENPSAETLETMSRLLADGGEYQKLKAAYDAASALAR